MEKTVDLPFALEVIGIDRNRFNYLFFAGRDVDGAKPLLRTKFPDATPGMARRLTRENCLEIAFVHALLSCGLIVPDARYLAEGWMESVRARGGRHKKIFPGVWVRNAAQRGVSAFHDETISIEEMLRESARDGEWVNGKPIHSYDPCDAIRVTIINPNEIVRQIDAMFASEGK